MQGLQQSYTQYFDPNRIKKVFRILETRWGDFAASPPFTQREQQTNGKVKSFRLVGVDFRDEAFFFKLQKDGVIDKVVHVHFAGFQDIFILANLDNFSSLLFEGMHGAPSTAFGSRSSVSRDRAREPQTERGKEGREPSSWFSNLLTRL